MNKRILRASSYILLMLFQSNSFAQIIDVSDAQAIHEIIRSSIGSYPRACPCPYSFDPDDPNRRPCGTSSAWSLNLPDKPICYPSEVTYAMRQSYIQQSGYGNEHVVGQVTYPLILHNKYSDIVSVTEIDPNKLTFVFNNVLYHPLIEEGCKNVRVGTILTVAHVVPVVGRRLTTPGIFFRLPDGSICVAQAIGSVY